MPPALEAFDFLRCTTRPELAALAGGQVAIMVDVTTMVRSDNALGEMRAGRTGIMIRRSIIDEVATREEAKSGPTRGIYLWHAGQHACALALQYLFAVDADPRSCLGSAPSVIKITRSNVSTQPRPKADLTHRRDPSGELGD